MVEALRNAWDELEGSHKLIIVVLGICLVGGVVWLISKNVRSWNVNRQLTRQLNAKEREEKEILIKLSNLATEKLKLDKKIVELEAQLDVKNKEANNAAINTANAQLEYNRAVRERRTDDPTIAQLCAELSAAGFPCTYAEPDAQPHTQP